MIRAGTPSQRLRGALRAFWSRLRTLTGDDAFERYLQHQARCHPGMPQLSRRQFYEEAQQRKWSGVSRCC